MINLLNNYYDELCYIIWYLIWLPLNSYLILILAKNNMNKFIYFCFNNYLIIYFVNLQLTKHLWKFLPKFLVTFIEWNIKFIW